jgi:predicted CoA-binding protein
LALAAYLKMKGYHLVKLNPKKSKSIFTFEIGAKVPEVVKMEFINSEFLSFYNEFRNLKNQYDWRN